jgi:hypothetical protein
LLGAKGGLLKISKDKLISQYYKGKFVKSLSHITNSLYLLGFFEGGLILWNQQNEQEMNHISDDSLDSIKRVMSTNNFIIKTNCGLKLLTIIDLESKKFTIQHLLDYKNDSGDSSDGLHV